MNDFLTIKPSYDKLITIQDKKFNYYYGAKLSRFKGMDVLILMDEDYQEFRRDYVYNIENYKWKYI